MHSWGFALREGVFAETKEGKCRNKRENTYSLQAGLLLRMFRPFPGYLFIGGLLFIKAVSLPAFVLPSSPGYFSMADRFPT